MKFASGDDEAIRPARFSDHLANFSDNEFTVYAISTISGCGEHWDDNRVAEIVESTQLCRILGVDGAKLADSDYVREVMLKYIAKLEAARAALRGLAT
jgi:hypothetical protein